MKRVALSAALLGIMLAPSLAEQVAVKYWGDVDLAGYECASPESSLVHRVCYDEAAAHVVVLLGKTYYAYCRVDRDTVDAWLAAESKGRFYNQNIKNDAVNGQFACN